MNLFRVSELRLLTGPQLVEEQRQGALILDTRDAERFASLHIRGSIQISLMGHFASWAAVLIKPAQRLGLVADNVQDVEEAHTRLIRVRLGQVIGYSLADEKQWREEGVDLASISIDRCEHVRQTLEHHPALQLVDVRSRAEWLKGHLPGAISLLYSTSCQKSKLLILPSTAWCTATKDIARRRQPVSCSGRALPISVF